MLEVLSNPGGFFEKKSKEETDLKPPFRIIGTLMIISLISAYILTNKIMGSLSTEVPTVAQLLVISLGLIVSTISVMIGWLITSSIFYLISLFLSGQGNMTRVLEFVAYGFLPFVLSSVISLVLMIGMYSSIDLPQDPQAIEQAMLSNPYMIASNVISIILALWSANIWVFAMIHSSNLTVKNALITVGVPIGVYLIYMLYTLYQALG
ncbi:YIP1 family protein [Methanomethylovorans sp.]|uniref:YIP1 family protein n=1 Tax=Methanomethylovorans sp. TaxID=2758717 RepID=UPI00351BF95F